MDAGSGLDMLRHADTDSFVSITSVSRLIVGIGKKLMGRFPSISKSIIDAALNFVSTRTIWFWLTLKGIARLIRCMELTSSDVKRIVRRDILTYQRTLI